MPELARRLKEWRAQQQTLTGTVFNRSVPTAVTLLKDLAACGIKGVDEHGRHLDFHALRHTFATILANAGISPRVAMELMRHSDMRLTAKTYTDAMNLPLFGELEKLTPALPSLPASLKCEKTGLETGISDQTDSPKKIADCVLTDDGRTVLTELVPPLEDSELAERGGFEPPTAFGCSRSPGVRIKPLCHLSGRMRPLSAPNPPRASSFHPPIGCAPRPTGQHPEPRCFWAG